MSTLMQKWIKHYSMPALFNLIRYKNLILIILVQVLLKYSLFESMEVSTALNHFHFILLVLATVFIAAGGYIINDIYDVSIDKINKPKQVIVTKRISENCANTLYLIFTFLGVATGFYISNHIGHPGFAALFIIIAALLYLYASFLKTILFVGTILISILVAMSLIIVGVFELVPEIKLENQPYQLAAFSVLFKYALFAFLLTFLREIIKDTEDVDGDKNAGRQTLPILAGRKRAVTTSIVLATGIVVLVLLYIYREFYRSPFTMLYFLILVIGPLLYFIIKAFTAEVKKDFHALSRVLKLVMVFGLLSLVLYFFGFI